MMMKSNYTLNRNTFKGYTITREVNNELVEWYFFKDSNKAKIILENLDKTYDNNIAFGFYIAKATYIQRQYFYLSKIRVSKVLPNIHTYCMINRNSQCVFETFYIEGTYEDAVKHQRNLFDKIIQRESDKKFDKKRERKPVMVVEEECIGLSKSQILETILLVKENIFNAVPRSEIIQTIKKKYPDLDEKKLTDLYNRGVSSYRNRLMTDHDLNIVINLHIHIYEEIYRYFSEISFIQGMNKALQQKEKLLGLHKESGIVELNQQNNINIVNTSSYNTDKLTENEKKRLFYFLEKVTKKA